MSEIDKGTPEQGGNTSTNPQPEATAPDLPKRIVSCELVRAMTYVVASVHFTEYMSWSPTKFADWDIYVVFDFGGRLFTAMLTFSFGLNLYFWNRSYTRKGFTFAERTWSQYRRAICFFICGILFNAIIWEFPHNLFDVDILLYYTFATLVLPLCFKLSPRQNLFFAVTVVVVALNVQRFFEKNENWAITNTGESEYGESIDVHAFECLDGMCEPEMDECMALPKCKEMFVCALNCAIQPGAGASICVQGCEERLYSGRGASLEYIELRDCGITEQCISKINFLPPQPGQITNVYVIELLRFVRAVIFEGHFALLPWLSFPLFGYATAGMLFYQHNYEVSLWRQRRLGCIAGLLLSTVSGVLGYRFFHRDDQGMSFVMFLDEELNLYPSTTWMYILWSLGCIFALLWLFERLNRLPNIVETRFGGLYVGFSLIARYALTYYVLQHMFIIWSLRIVSVYEKGTYAGGSWHYYENKVVPAWPAAIAGYVFTFCFWILMYHWEGGRLKSRFTLEWVVRAVSMLERVESLEEAMLQRSNLANKDNLIQAAAAAGTTTTTTTTTDADTTATTDTSVASGEDKKTR